MPRLIDANKLRKDVLDLPNCYNGFSDTYDKAMIIDLIDEQPTVDAIEVVRCKDCQYLEPALNSDWSWCYYFDSKVRGDDFCSHGERRDDADNR